MPTDYGDLQLLINEGKLIPLAVDGTPHGCPNCGGAGIVYAFKICGGPHRAPPAVGAKWLSNINGSEGWYSGELQTVVCPVCHPAPARTYVYK